MPELNWLGRRAVEITARRTAVRALKPRKKGDAGLDVRFENLLIQADSLTGLKALGPFYSGAFKLIYMDPPYNTGNTTWVYSDRVDSPQIRAWLDKEVGPEDLARSDKWLCMMRPRIELALELLRPGDGVLAISIDDAEVAHLTVLLDSLLGRRNHIATICWRTRPSNNKAHHVGVIHEYVLLYARNFEALKETGRWWRIPKPGVDEVLDWAAELMADEDLSDEERSAAIRERHNEKIRSLELELSLDDPDLSEREVKSVVKKRWDALRRYNRFDERGLFRPDNLSWVGGGGPRYEVLHPVTKKPVPVPEGGWMWVEDVMTERLAEGRVLFGADETTIPQQKIYLAGTAEGVLNSVVEIPGKNGTEDLKKVVPEASFPYPKPVALIQTLIELTTQPGDLVLDPFVGSGTTAEAVLRLNAQDKAQAERRFVCIEMESEIEEEITKTRLNRVIGGYRATDLPGIGGSYSRWTVGKPYRALSGALGGATPTEVLRLLAAHHAKGKVEIDVKRLRARADGLQLFLFLDPGVFGREQFAAVAASLGDDHGVVYATTVLVDEEECSSGNVTALQLPYDLPVQPV